MDFEKLRKEEQEAERLAGFNSDKDPIKTEEEEEPIVKEEQTPPVKKNNWKERFTSYKSSTDSTIYTLRKENKYLTGRVKSIGEELKNLKEKFGDLKEKSSIVEEEERVNSLFTQEDVDILGPEAIDVMKRVVKSQKKDSPNEELERLKKEVADLRQKEVEEIEEARKRDSEESFNKLKTMIESQVPDWNEIDSDVKFMEYLDDIDPVSGKIRKDLFGVAVRERDVYRVVSFYKDFKSTRKETKEEILRRKVTPSGSSVTTVDDDSGQSTEYYTINEYTTFMDNLAKGRYRERVKEAKIMEAKFDKAFAEGRVR